MATPKEIRERLESLTPDAFTAFKKAYGGEGFTPERYAREAATRPELEYRICSLLGLPTEQERSNQAQGEAAGAARRSADAAETAAREAAESNRLASEANAHAAAANRIAEEAARAARDAAAIAASAQRLAIASLVITTLVSLATLAVAVIALWR